MKSRPAVQADFHGVYQHRPVGRSLFFEFNGGRAASLSEELAGKSSWAEWQRNGSLTIKGMFDWLWTGAGWGETNEAGIGALIDHEFNMYLHHQAQRNLSPNYGWLRTMVHSLTQQIVRGDPTYYAVYVCMRPDLNRRLVSYPYYAKFATLGDTTAFRHIDLNVPKYLKTGKGGNIIQGSVSFDNETERNCTEIVPGFHQVIDGWWADVKTGDRTVSKALKHDRPIHGLEKLWLSEHAKTYGDFMPVPCQRGDARITLPTIPHGSRSQKLTSQERRRTLLPW